MLHRQGFEKAVELLGNELDEKLGGPGQGNCGLLQKKISLEGYKLGVSDFEAVALKESSRNGFNA